MLGMDQQVNGCFQFGVAFSAGSLDIDEEGFATVDTFSMDGRESSRDALQTSSGVAIEFERQFTGRLQYQHEFSDTVKSSSQLEFQRRYIF